MSSLSAYLASKYLTADPAPTSGTKKRKRKDKSKSAAETGLIIADDDADDPLFKSNTNGDEDEAIPIIGGRSAEFKKKKQSTWKVVGSTAPSESDLSRRGDADSAAADAIIAATARETHDALHEDEDPAVVKMADGTHAGLQSGAEVAAQMERAAARERARWEKESKTHNEAETVYRDATGRRIDISMRRAEARREQEEQEKKERQAKEELLGDVQKREKEKRREELEEAKFTPFARTVDDEKLNEELKRRARWDDPALGFLTQKEEARGSGKVDVDPAAAPRGSSKPMYKGGFPPNRYGIRPGHRWDGVDRSNGWEAERFKGLNRRERNKQLNFEWQEDM
jgi:pre-mRNA-splicing factor CWC26